ncbi:hypothetical protein [Pseudomonas sp.]|uniref:hypothetical protein n=1 Tax=Pseudomonas sp. TaxID=306 RepID=UPI00272B995A|nr:hypothetical protein [Pseudomonas sp.]
MAHDRSEPSRLLQDLESIRTLLDEPAKPELHAEVAIPQLDIPVLDDVIEETIPLVTDILDEPELTAPSAVPSPPEAVTAAAPVVPEPAQPLSNDLPATPERPHNPFLPYDSLARLAEERMQLDRLLAGHVPPPPRDAVHTGAREVRLEARLRAEAQLVLQEIIDDFIPTIEAELRNRLQGKLDELVREQLK